MSEEEDAVIEAEVEIKAHALGVFLRDPENRQAIDARRDELFGKTVGFPFDGMDMVTQATLSRLFANVLKDPDVVDVNDLKLVFALGMAIAKEKSDAGDKR